MLSVVNQTIRTFLMIATGIVAMTCGDAIEEIPTPGNNPPPGTEAISDEDRHKVLEECGAFADKLGDLTSDIAQQTLVQFLNTKSEFEAAGISGKNVWAYFNDGRIVMFVPYWEDVEEEGGRLATSGRTAVTNGTPSAEARTENLPKTNSVTLFNGLGKLFKDDRDYLKTIFERSNTNYSVDLKEASIENLKAVNNLGIFFISTHGGLGYEKPIEDSSATFGLWTTTPATPENDKKYVVDLDWYRLIYMRAYHDDKIKKPWHYAISKEFVREYMSFADNALQYIDACNSIRPQKLDEFREVMLKKAKNGMGTYIGWSAPTSSKAGTPTLRFIFDRLLGAHDQSVPMEDPVQRPFDVAAIFEDLKSFDLGVSSGGGIINYYTNVKSKPILTPSIEYIDMRDSESEMRITGLFGEDPGTDGIVTVDGVAVHVDDWTEDIIVCNLPDTGPGSSGDVIVSVRGNKSNVVPLSEWTISMNLSNDEIGMTTEAILNLRLRADIHSYRSKPGESPKPPRVDPLLSIAGQPFAIGSTGTYSVGGQTRITCKSAGCDIKDNRNVAARSGQLPYRIASSSELGFVAFYTWSADMKKLSIMLDVSIPNVGVELENITICPGIASVTVPSSMERMFGIHHYQNPMDPVSRLELTLDDKFTIQSGKKTRPLPLPDIGLDCTGTLQMVTTAQWSSAIAAFPPNKDTEARVGDD